MVEQQQRSWWSRNWKWVLPVGCLTPVLVCGGCVAVILTAAFGTIKSSTPYQDSLAAVRNSPQAQAALGVPIEPGFLVTGEIEATGASGHADIGYSVSGPQGSGTVYAVADKSAGEWTFSTLVLELKETGERLDLLAQE